jgi:hypothetical protein
MGFIAMAFAMIMLMMEHLRASLDPNGVRNPDRWRATERR